MAVKKLILSCLLLLASSANASIIGQWTDGGRSWNHSSYSKIKDTLVTGGHTVEADGALTAANLANDDMFVIGETARALTAQESDDLEDWVKAGGIFWLSVDSNSNVAFSNNMLTVLGSGMSFSNASSGSGSPLAGGNFATDKVYDIVGDSLKLSPGKSVWLGGAASYLSDDILAFEQIGLGWVFAAGDRFEHNFSIPTAASVNGQLMLNVAAGPADPSPVPVPATLWLFGAALVGFFGVSRRRIVS